MVIGRDAHDVQIARLGYSNRYFQYIPGLETRFVRPDPDRLMAFFRQRYKIGMHYCVATRKCYQLQRAFPKVFRPPDLRMKSNLIGLDLLLNKAGNLTLHFFGCQGIAGRCRSTHDLAQPKGK